MNCDKAQLLVQHYQDTYELTYRLWAQRNRIFLILLAVVASASLLTYAPETNSLLLSWIGKAVGISDQTKLRASVPFALLQGVLLAVVFYLMVNLFHRALYVLRNYAYLGNVEKEIRDELSISENDHAFTRESTYYWSDRPWPLTSVKWVYAVFLGALLLAFLIGRILADWNNRILLCIDIGMAIPTLGYYAAFFCYSVGLDKRSDQLGGNAGQGESNV